MQCFIQALDRCACRAIFRHCHVVPHIDWEGICTSSRQKLKRACTLLGLKDMTTYERVKYATAGPVTDTYFELKMLCLFCLRK